MQCIVIFPLYNTVQKFGINKKFFIFEGSQIVHVWQNSNIVKYNYNLNEPFSIFIYFEM